MRRITRTFHIAPTTRAIRAALAISFTVLALAGSGAALAAGTCTTDTTLNTVTCDGDFNSLPGGNFVPVADMTLILGDNAPSSVTPGVGVIGIDAEWGGNVGITSHADITTSGADGIFEYGSTSATLTNDGAITTNVTAPGAKAIDISSYGNVSVTNSGAVKAYSTGAYDVTAIAASSLFGNAVVTNATAGTITATAEDGNAIAIDASAYHAVVIANEGTITASSVNGIAIGALDQSSAGEAYFSNLGSITVTSTNGQAVGALVSGNVAYANNRAYSAYGYAGSISVTSGADAAIGLEAYGRHYAEAKNTGSITVTSDGGTATGMIADSYQGAARITNTGSIRVKSLYYAPAIGVQAYSAFSGAASVNNSGTISATAVSGNATGIIAAAHYGQVGVVNSGDVSATAGVGNYYQHNRGIGIVASSGAGYSPGITHVTNSGNITASGPTLGEGVVGSARYGDLTITNTATGNIKAYGQNEAIGIGTGQNAHNGFGRYIDGYTSQADIYNAGSITAAADGTNCATCKQIEATGIQVFLNQGHDVTVSNSGDIAVSVRGGSSTVYSEALGMDLVTNTGNVTVNNSGSISVSANNISSDAVYNVGILTNTNLGDTSIVNSGDIHVSVDGSFSYKNFGIWAATSSNGDKSVDNGGVSVVNSGNINLDDLGNSVVDMGIYVGSSTRYGHKPVTVINSGDLNVSAPAGVSEMYGIQAYTTTYGDFTVNNSGSITTKNNTFTAYSYNGTAFPGSGGISMGILAKFNSAGGTATITNSGDISATGASNVMGIYARYVERTNYYSTANVTINNSGSVSATADNFDHVASAYVAAFGIRSRNDDGTTTLANSGSITATVSEDPAASAYGGAHVVGIEVDDTSPGQTHPEIAHLAPGYGTISIDNSGSIAASITSNAVRYAGFDTADGIAVRHGYGAVNVVNSGAISASARDDASTVAGTIAVTANGISIAKNWNPSSAVYSQGSETLTNSSTGSITASATSNYADVSTGATGIFTVLGLTSSSIVSADRANTIDNAGWVSATATVGGADTVGTATATGVSAFSWDAGLVDVTNSGDIVAMATSPGVAIATGLYASASNLNIALNAGSYVGATASGASGIATGLSLVASGTTAFSVANSGGVKATFTGAGNAYGANVTSAGDLSFTNAGQIFAGSGGNAVGIRLNNPTSTTLVNSGTVGATSTATDSTANATAISLVNAAADGSLNVTNSGSVLATASSSGSANATGILASAQNVTLALNAGDYIGATATGSSGAATGLSLVNAGTTAFSISNPGTITATFNGAGGKAFGASITSAGDVSFTNAGQIFAANGGDAVGLQLNSATSNSLVNSGLVSAVSSAGSSIAVRTNDATATIQNTGTINGAIVTGAGNDTFTNSVGAIWNPIGTSTDFGAGDDTVSNAGTINLHNSAITLGSSGEGGNTFSNSGMIASLGGNTINVGAGNAFTNPGSVEMRNGLTTDALTLTGNWAGSGQIGVDVSPAHGSSDKLHVIGNVAAGSATVVNVNLLDLPDTVTGSVPVVDVTGDSVAGNFVLGDVHFNTAKSFLVVQAVDLTAKIDSSNATPDVFSVGVAVTGVTDSGALAASIVPGIESLMNSEVGTWRQRMGVFTPAAKGSVGLWARAFDDSGTVNPGHLASNFGQGGNFSFGQTNSGEEIGADFAITENLSAGLMLGKARGNQHINGNGVGRNKISGDTRGAYITWMTGGGFYVDGSYRSMSFDARLDSQVGESRTTGNADAFNIEIGQSWAFGDGFKLIPQLQYTRTTVSKADTLTGALAGFTPAGGSSSRGRAGVTLSDDITSGSTVWTPYASLSAVHEFDGKNDFTINNAFAGTTNTKGTSALVEGGLNVHAGKFDVFGGVNYQAGGALKSFAGGQVGLRVNW